MRTIFQLPNLTVASFAIGLLSLLLQFHLGGITAAFIFGIVVGVVGLNLVLRKLSGKGETDDALHQ